jgi:hypothetical protein
MLAATARAAGPQSSTDYQFTIESIDGGGLRAASAGCTGDHSFSAGSFVTSADYKQRGGYIGQLNNLPVAAAFNVGRTAGLDLLILLSDLTNSWSDVDGDSVTRSGINLVTTNGVTVRTNSVLILYSNTRNVNDQISYAIHDSEGGTGSGVINITVTPFVTGQSTGTLMVSGGTVSATFYGIPSFTYEVQRSTNLVDWVTISTNTVGSNGVFNVTDTFPDLGGSILSSAYYRMEWHP